MNAVKNYETQVQPKQQPPVRRVVKRVQPKKKQRLYTLRNLAVLGGIMAFAILFGQLWLDSQSTAIHAETENLRLQINAMQLNTGQLQSQILELSSYTRIMEVAGRHGLDYFDGNIIFAE